MLKINDVINTTQRLFGQGVEFIRSNPLVATVGGLGALGSGAGLYTAVKSYSTKRKARKKTTSKKKSTRKYTKRKTTRKRSKKSTSKKRTSSKKIYKTKNGQPYIKLASGKARFISKKSATLRRKRKGGYY